MGRGYVKQKNKLKMEFNAQLRKMVDELQKENQALKNDPNSVVGQFVGQFRELYGQNQRLSTLAAVLIKKLNDSVVLTKEELEQFSTKRINIKWEVGDDETVETATKFVFTYELQDAPPQGMPVQPTEDPASIPECTDPECSLPKDLKHRHTLDNPVVPVEKTQEVCTDPDCNVPETYGEHVHVGEAEPLSEPVVYDDAINTGDDVNGKSLPYAEPELPALTEECNDPNCEATVNGPHIHGKKLTPQ
jgi:hypothetical protein